MLTLNEKIQQALKNKSFHHAKLDGKLTNYKPKTGQIIIFNDGTEGRIIKEPNSVGDYLVELSDNIRIRKNTINDDVLGFLD